MNDYYRPSGRIALSSIVYLVIFTIIFVPLLSYLYSLAILNIPFIYVKFIITIIFGWAIYGVASLVILKGKVRNVNAAFIFTIIIVLLSVYLHYATWVYMIGAERSIDLPKIIQDKSSSYFFVNNLSLVLFPNELFKSVLIIVENGIWEFKRETIGGSVYWFIILIEFSILMFIPLKYSIRLAKKPFCEISNKWFQENKLPLFSLIKDKKDILDPILNGSYLFPKIIQCNNEKESHSEITIYSSENEVYLKLENKIKIKDSTSFSDFKTEILINNIKISKNLIYEDFVKTNQSSEVNNEDEDFQTNAKDYEISGIVLENKVNTDKKNQSKEKEVIKKSGHIKSSDKKPFRNILKILGFGVIVALSVFYIFNFYKNSNEIIIKDYKNNIESLLTEEENRNFESIYSHFSQEITRYWDIKNPNYESLKKRYEYIWGFTSNSKNHIKKIEKINDNTYDLYTEFEYYHLKKKKTISASSRVRYIFDDQGKILETYGLD